MGWLSAHGISIAVSIAAVVALAAAAVLAIAAYSAHTVVRPRRTWQPEGWQPPAHELEDVCFRNGAGASLRGWLLPPAPGKAVVLICHGFGTNRREGQDLLPW